MSKTLIGITSFGGLPFLKLAIRSIRETATVPVDICVIVAKPGDKEMWDWLREEKILWIRNDENKGFPASVNDLYEFAFTLGDYDNLIICGNDVVLLPGAIDAMIHTANTTDYEMICGSEFDVRFLVNNYPEARQYFQGENLVFTDFNARPWELHKDFRNGVEPDCRKDIRNFTLFKRSAFEKVGYADVNFFPNGYFEDLNACLRLDRAGVSACGLKEAAFFHFWSRTIHQGESREHSKFYQRNERYYIEKWGGGWQQEKYALPFHGDPYYLGGGIGIVLEPTLRIADRWQEAKIIEYWSRL